VRNLWNVSEHKLLHELMLAALGQRNETEYVRIDASRCMLVQGIKKSRVLDNPAIAGPQPTVGRLMK